MKSCFENKDIYVGINVHKKRWVVTVRTYDLDLQYATCGRRVGKVFN